MTAAMIRLLLIAISLNFLACDQANAHVGHLGELAGHGHWIGLGAVAVAGALVALLGKKTRTPENEGAEIDPGEEETNGEADAA